MSGESVDILKDLSDTDNDLSWGCLLDLLEVLGLFVALCETLAGELSKLPAVDARLGVLGRPIFLSKRLS